MKKHAIVVAPHPDDETLGCGGALLKHKSLGHATHWLILSSMNGLPRYAAADRARRQKEIDRAARLYGFSSVHQADFPTTRLDTIPMGDLVASVGKIFEKIKPDTVYLPFEGDVQSAASWRMRFCPRPSFQPVSAGRAFSPTSSSISRRSWTRRSRS